MQTCPSVQSSRVWTEHNFCVTQGLNRHATLCIVLKNLESIVEVLDQVQRGGF